MRSLSPTKSGILVALSTGLNVTVLYMLEKSCRTEGMSGLTNTDWEYVNVLAELDAALTIEFANFLKAQQPGMDLLEGAEPNT